jgi:type VI secretion system protein
MSGEKSLLERLRDPEPESSRSIHQNTSRLSESVMANLRNLLNTRQGLSSTAPDYGIPDLVDVLHSFPDAINGMRKAIKASIEKYEPRLRRVNVKYVESPGEIQALRYEITAELVTEDEKASIWIQTRIDRSGEVEVKG